MAQHPDIRTARIYDVPEDGSRRVLVDRLWPRGISKRGARLDRWARELAPSDELRRWFNHDLAKWRAFQQRYRRELDVRMPEAAALLDWLAEQQRPVTLLYAARDTRHNHAIVLARWLARRLADRAR